MVGQSESSKRKRNIKLRNLLIIVYSSIIILITVTISMIMMQRFRDILENHISLYISRVVSNANLSIDNFLREIDVYSLYILQDQEAINSIIEFSNEELSSHRYNQIITQRLQNYKVPFFSSLKSVWIKTTANNHISGIMATDLHFNADRDHTLLVELEALSGESRFGETVWTGIYTLGKSESSMFTDYIYGSRITDQSFFALRNLKDLNTFRNIGLLIVELDKSLLQELTDPFIVDPNDGLMLLDRSGAIIYCSGDENDIVDIVQNLDEEAFQQLLTEDRGDFIINNVFYSYATSSYSGWKTVFSFPMDSVYSDVFSVQRTMFIATILGVALGVLAAVFVSVNIEKPVSKILAQMNALLKNNFDADFDINTNIAEVTHLSYGLKQLLSRIKGLISDIYRDKQKEKELEIKVLQLQINPHFLYNTLDTLRWQLVLSNNNDTADAIVALSDLLRFSISGDSGLTTIEEELHQLDHYFTIQKLRFGNRFNIKTDYDPDAMKYSIPKLTLQPIVENAINHGLGGKNYFGEINISIKLAHDDIIISIEDNGIGMTEEKLEHLSSRSDSGDDTVLGIKNTSDRIVYLMNKQDAIKISSLYGEGTLVEIHLPRIEAPDN